MASKSKSRRRVFRASCILAALIVAGSSFAWFTSKDEVTNRLSAAADYGVSIVEDFTPPSKWVPGQEVEKNVSVVNTGNVDSFVRVWLEGEFNLIKEGAGISALPSTAYAPAAIDDDAELKSLGFEKVTVEGTTSYLKVLSKDKTINPENSNETKDSSDAYTEVQALQAGGYLAYAPTGAKYKYTLNQNKAVDVYKDSTNHYVTDVPAGAIVTVNGTAAAPSGTSYIAPANTAGDIDSDTFLPMTTGLYLFRRNMDVDTGKTDKDWEYSGYYYVATESDTGGQGKYYALKTKTVSGDDTVYTDGVLLKSSDTTPTWYVDQQTGAFVGTTSATALAGVKLLTAERAQVKDDGVTWTYAAATNGDPAKLTASIHTAGGNTQADLISIDVILANVDGTNNPNESWQRVAATTDHRDTFYYKNDVEEGDTTAKLIDAVVLDKGTKQTAYIAFDFDLNVNMDSIQVTLDTDDNECFTSVQDEWASSSKAVAQTAEATVAKEINDITWKTNT